MAGMYRYETPLGFVRMLICGDAVCGLWFEGEGERQEYEARMAEHPSAPVFSGREAAVLTKALAWLNAYFAGEDPGPVPPLRLEGTAFRRRVWEVLQTIPYGQTMTYGQIARVLAEERGIERMSAQAVGGAVGHNPVSLMVPCHRVVGSKGGLTGYAGGVERKAALLELERG